ncbi:MAG: RNA-binding protein, partial [Verrucomicrobiales bacterium]|nr:RNA-binding protein [Verrucomicrobiales bacterium]
MGNKVFVGGIPWAASDQDLRDLFSETGEVTDAVILQDRETGKSRGFGFVTYASDDDAQSSVEKFNGHEFMGRELTVNEARPREERSGGGGGGGGYGGGGRGGGGGGGGRGGG